VDPHRFNTYSLFVVGECVNLIFTPTSVIFTFRHRPTLWHEIGTRSND